MTGGWGSAIPIEHQAGEHVVTADGEGVVLEVLDYRANGAGVHYRVDLGDGKGKVFHQSTVKAAPLA